MTSKKILTNIFGWGVISCLVIVVAFRIIQTIPLLIELSQLRFYPERVPLRTVVSTDDFLLKWSLETNDGSQHLSYTQIFAVDSGTLVYITPLFMNSIDFFTGERQWSVEIPEDSIFRFHNGKIFTLNTIDESVSYMPVTGITIPSKCNSMDRSTLRVYDPANGELIWEHSYQMVYPGQIYFRNDVIFVNGMTISAFKKYISIFKVDPISGQILDVECQDYQDYSRISDDEGILSSGFYPITREWEWSAKTDNPAFITDGSKLIMVDRSTKEQLKKIEFSGFSLNPDAVQIILRNDVLVVFLDDSNQFFVFQTK